MKLEEKVRIVGNLQIECADTFVAVLSSVKPGMSEHDIANELRAHMAWKGIADYWYEVPFIVLIGVERFCEGTTTTDYGVKAPSPDVVLSRGDVIHVDFSPMDPATGIRGDWSSTGVYQPETKAQHEQVDFLEKMRTLHREGARRITASTTGADVANYFHERYKQFETTLLDVRNNVGHSIHTGPKAQANRTWLDTTNTTPLGPGIFTVEPGGVTTDGTKVVRFEECI